jgi:hypothetical protein
MPPRATYEPFTGRVLAFDVDGMDLPVGRQLPPRGLARVLSGPQWQATTTIATDSLEPRRSVIVRIAEEFTVLVSVEQVGRDFVCLQKTRSADFKFRSPKVAANDALAAAVGENTSPMKLTCARRHAWLVAGVDGSEARLRLSPALGWLLLSPFDFAITTREAWVGWLWLLGLAFPAGYWAGTIRGSDALARKRRRTAAAAIAGSLVAGLSLAPLATTTSPGNVREWAAAITGVVVGLLVARAVRPASSR